MTRRFWPAVASIAALLFAVELVFLPRAGMQADEVLFATPFFKGVSPLYEWHWGTVRVPVMIMDYIGALKMWLYWPVFRAWPMGLWAVRLPACLISVATLIVFADAIRRVAGIGTGLTAALFLATDAPFVLTNVYDWGPVALLLLATASSINLLTRRRIAAAAFVAGVATWYKAVFIFPLAAMLVAAAIVCFRELRIRAAMIAAIAFAAGVSPLIAFNLAHPAATISAAADLGRAPLGEKILMMERTLDGRALEHYLFRSFAHEKIALSGAPLPVLVRGWYQRSGLGPASALPVLLALSLAALWRLRRDESIRTLLFAWIASAAVGGLLLAFRGAGTGPHHTVLVDPGPQFLVAATLVAQVRMDRRWRVAATAAGVLLVVSNIYLLERYYAAARDNGFSVYWTDAERPLTRTIAERGIPAAFLDWGIRDVVRTESDDRIALAPDEQPRVDTLYVEHCDGYVIDGGRKSDFEHKLSVAGLRRVRTETVADSFGNSVFCLSELAR